MLVIRSGSQAGLLPPLIGEHVKQTVSIPMPAGAKSTRINALATMLASEACID